VTRLNIAEKLLPNQVDVNDDIFHKEIIETFFGKSRISGKPKVEPAQKIEKPVDAQPSLKDAPQKTEVKALPVVKRTVKMNYVLTGILGGVVFAALIGAALFLSFNTKQDAGSEGIVRTSNYVKYLANGVFDRGFIKNLYFDGDPLNQSRFLRNSLKLTNNGGDGHARAIFVFNEYADFSDGNLLILARSNPGSSVMRVTMTDAFAETHVIAVTLSPSWQWKNMRVSGNANFDLTKVLGLSVEYISSKTGMLSDTSIYIKEIGFRSANL